MTRLTLKAEPPVRISLHGLTPRAIAPLDATAIAHLPRRVGRREERIGDWFTIDQTADRTHLVIAGSCTRCDHIGAHMSEGEILVAGDAGAYLGQGMSGGEIRVEGKVGDAAGAEMAGGTLHIGGDAGAALASGMSGGTMILDGSAGERAGERMARGLLVIAGQGGALIGTGMRAGTILLGGQAGPDPGVSMRRGSLVVLGGMSSLGSGFADSGTHELLILKILAHELRHLGLGFEPLASRLAGRFHLFLGDRALGGKGEALFAR
ncbi:MAG TPA: formylmethanofuran dehydrogenase subunit C [Stellaceae bacterium]|nr:formylmethanofuran dehydrogenase subunit C [Stellaceae bacterium]